MRLAVVLLLVAAVWAGGVAAAAEPYPSTPYPLADAPSALVLPESVGGPAVWGEEVWVATRGRVLSLEARAGGSLALTRVAELPRDVAPTGLASSGDGDFFLDAVGERVLVYRSEGSRRAPVGKLAVGPEPSGMVAGSGIPEGSWVIVPNAGASDFSLYRSRRGLVFGAERRTAVGARPSSIVPFNVNGELAIANTGSGTVSNFTAPGSSWGFGREGDIAVGGAPSVLAVADSLDADLNDDVSDDLLVADAARETVTLLLSRQRPPWFRPAASFPVGHVDAMVVSALDYDRHPDLAVADRQSGRVLVFAGARGARFGAPRVVAAGLDPVAIVAGQFGGDHQPDLLVADARSRSVRLLLTPGDRLLASTGRARHLVAAGARGLLWSERVDRRRHRLLLWRAGKAARLPVAPSQLPLVARAGRWRGHSVVSYVRCRRGRCRPFAWDLVDGRERPLRVRVPGRCVLRDLQLWGHRRAYVVGRDARCPRAAQGLWTQWRARPARLVSRTGRLGALRGGRLVFKDRSARTLRWRLRLTGPGRRVRTLARTPPFYLSDLFGPLSLDGRYVYWSVSSAIQGRPILVRRRLHRRSPCAETWPRPRSEAFSIDGWTEFFDDEPHADFSVRQGGIFYVNDAGVLKTDSTASASGGRVRRPLSEGAPAATTTARTLGCRGQRRSARGLPQRLSSVTRWIARRRLAVAPGSPGSSPVSTSRA